MRLAVTMNVEFDIAGFAGQRLIEVLNITPKGVPQPRMHPKPKYSIVKMPNPLQRIQRKISEKVSDAKDFVVKGVVGLIVLSAMVEGQKYV